MDSRPSNADEGTSSIASTTSTATEEESIDLSLATLSDKVVTAMNDLNNTTDFSKESSSTMLEEILDVYSVLRKERRDDLDKVCQLLISNGLLELFIRFWNACHENTEEFYTQTDSVKFSKLYSIKRILWNYSDKCVELAKICYQNGDVIERLMREFTIPQFDVSSLEQEPLREMMMANLGILHNLVRDDTRNRNHIRKDNGIEKMLIYEKSTYLMIKSIIFIVVAYCINEDDNEQITAGRGVNEFIIEMLLASAVKSPDHLAHISGTRFSAEEILKALHKLASNDANKKAMVEAGVLPLLTKLLDQETSSHSEHLEAVNCIWSLAFHPENKERIIEEPGLMEGVTKLRDEFKSDMGMNKACSSLLFVLKMEQPTEEVHDKQKVDERHIMLSYNWEVQDVMLKLYDFLKQKNYSIWMDVHNMQGSILSAMADAVENAALIIVAMTESYKNSNACRTEAEYAYKRKVPILPLLMQRNYEADGWLGAMMGMKLYVNLSSGDVKGKFEEARQHVNKLMNSTTKTGSGNHDVKPRHRETVVDGRASTVAEERASTEHRVKMEIYDHKKEIYDLKKETYDLNKKLLRGKLEHKKEIHDLKKKLLQRKLELVEAEIAEKKN